VKQCQGACKSGMPTGRNTVPFVVEHGGWMVFFVGSIIHIIRQRTTMMMWFCCKKANS
jgi:hypothetical protein